MYVQCKIFKSKEMQDYRCQVYAFFIYTGMFYLVTLSNQWFCNIPSDILKKHIILRTAPLFVDLYSKLNLYFEI